MNIHAQNTHIKDTSAKDTSAKDTHAKPCIRREIGPIEAAQRAKVKSVRNRMAPRLALTYQPLKQVTPQPVFKRYCPIEGRTIARLGYSIDQMGRDGLGILVLPMSDAKRQSLKHFELAVPFTNHHRIKLIIAACAKKHGVSVIEIRSKRRFRNIVAARYEAMWRVARKMSLSFPQIGRAFGCDHTTVLHALRKHEARRDAEGTGNGTGGGS